MLANHLRPPLHTDQYDHQFQRNDMNEPPPARAPYRPAYDRSNRAAPTSQSTATSEPNSNGPPVDPASPRGRRTRITRLVTDPHEDVRVAAPVDDLLDPAVQAAWWLCLVGEAFRARQPQVFRPDRHRYLFAGRSRSNGRRRGHGTAAVEFDDRPIRSDRAQSAVQKIGLANEVGYESIVRSLVDLLRTANLDNPAAAHDGDPVRHGQCLFLIMRHVDEGDADRLLQSLQLALHLLAQLEIERAQRLVEQQHGRVIDQGPGQRDPLLLATGQLPRTPFLVPCQSHQRKRVCHAIGDLRASSALHAQPEGDVFGNVHVRKERVVLEDGIDIAREGRGCAHDPTLDAHAAIGGVLEAGDHAKRGRLAASGRTEQGEELAGFDAQRHAIDRDHVTERFPDLQQFHVGGGVHGVHPLLRRWLFDLNTATVAAIILNPAHPR